MFKKRISIPVMVISCIICFALGVTGFYYFSSIGSMSGKLREFERVVMNNFDGEIDAAEVDEAVFSAYLKALDDKYATYVPASEAEEFKDGFKGEGAGIGVTMIKNDAGNMEIVTVHKDSPADKAGLKTGDEITGADDKTIDGIGYEELYKYIRSKQKGDNINLTVLRDGAEQKITVTYGEYTTQTVFYHKINQLGYIKFTHFDAATVEQFETALDDLMQQDVKGLIFDVRGNGGGTVDSVCKILDKLLPECDLISAKYKDGKEVVLHRSDKNEIDLPMSVLTDGGTASASELFAAAIREKRDGLLYGEKTYGKSVMQTTFNLSDGSCVKITVAKFYSPDKNNWDGTGLSPDKEIKLTEEQQKNYYKLTDETDPVIKAAADDMTAKIAG